MSVPWCELCSPKADNTSMAGGRGLLQWYQSKGPATIGRDLSLASHSCLGIRCANVTYVLLVCKCELCMIVAALK